MPVELSYPRTPGGHVFIRAEAREAVAGDEARALISLIAPGGEHHEKALLAVVHTTASFSPEARKALSRSDPERNAKGVPAAIVMHSAALRVTLSFILKIAGAGGRSKLFATEAEAAAWLARVLDAPGR